ncbi:MAG: class F sortase [Anaerolineae bacterium]|nr:class F sortase [Thermoflexales bacterium]MDW8396346.1 class F sortase [Anaerolineae bacterium]
MTHGVRLVAAAALSLAQISIAQGVGEGSSPVRLSVPSLRLRDVPVILLPIINGAWDEARLGAREVGLLQTTGRWPNDTWAIVLAGHVTLEGNQPGPFYGLGSLRPGDSVFLHSQDGLVWHYQVKRQYSLKPNQVKSVYRRDGRLLLLLTCASWDEPSQTYSRRLVVEAELVAQDKRLGGTSAPRPLPLSSKAR